MRGREREHRISLTDGLFTILSPIYLGSKVIGNLTPFMLLKQLLLKYLCLRNSYDVIKF